MVCVFVCMAKVGKRLVILVNSERARGADFCSNGLLFRLRNVAVVVLFGIDVIIVRPHRRHYAHRTRRTCLYSIALVFLNHPPNPPDILRCTCVNEQ